MAMPRLSVIIPALNEEDVVAQAVRSVRDEAEVIVVDGGSEDRTRAVAEAEGAAVLAAPAGRGRQLDAGARRAAGEWLVFLHADTRLEAGWASALRRLGADVVGGAFRFAIDSPVSATGSWRRERPSAVASGACPTGTRACSCGERSTE
jgi:glycosyltransferase involved in cell wall biosynthesis